MFNHIQLMYIVCEQCWFKLNWIHYTGVVWTPLLISSLFYNNNILLLPLRYWRIRSGIFSSLTIWLSNAVITVSQVTEDSWVFFQMLMTFSSLVMSLPSLCFNSSKTSQRTCNADPKSYHLSQKLNKTLNNSYLVGVSFNILVISEITKTF